MPLSAASSLLTDFMHLVLVLKPIVHNVVILSLLTTYHVPSVAIGTRNTTLWTMGLRTRTRCMKSVRRLLAAERGKRERMVVSIE